jgi:hypothetical protein
MDRVEDGPAVHEDRGHLRWRALGPVDLLEEGLAGRAEPRGLAPVGPVAGGAPGWRE